MFGFKLVHWITVLNILHGGEAFCNDPFLMNRNVIFSVSINSNAGEILKFKILIEKSKIQDKRQG